MDLMDLSLVMLPLRHRYDVFPVPLFSYNLYVKSSKVGGPIALIQDGDRIIIDAESRKIDVMVSPEELNNRREKWNPPPLKANRGTLYKYIKNVSSASKGCVTDE